ncbi:MULTISPECIES: glycosyl hydrolase family 28-related protein [unclassified Sphingopyxis]|uniref:glycosyl hydrolase family 28-related protein n=1 Tax=unclassified Sphingopyxis TaxID=2614943 RepID=UPI000730722B|nr:MULTISPECIES: glycosyl hydrolase family 28-related protein [unclassified Sphingopyxis]KTE23153.1 hypothetical protein ATE61_17860 [Sphingopyxis sp. H057]KTE48492.1 hypothetical protein ATE64_20700 [Sphingopyxis sp. H073]KTE50091.1 hypothetical protein ATE69_18655 [Sphingopyxis sp. H071]KTE58502.1 hypothetical protein ATE66_15085 [Sphingopyxis sp. H107]KTE63201.1 hypothetical protein ATE65_16210 [Sphingopyxis sp. H100]
MYKYVNAFTNRSGDSLPGYFARLYDNTGTEVDIFADNNGTPISTVSGVSNAALSDDNGMFRWYVANGIYDIKFYDANDTFVTSEAGVPMYDSGAVLDDLAETTGAGSVGYDAEETYTVGTVGSKLKKAVFVTDPPYNAKGDGSTDDLAAIEAAIAAAPVNGTLTFPAGVYIVSDTVDIARNDLTIVGYGAVLKAKASTSFEYVLYGTGISNVKIRGLTIDANQANRTSGQNVRYVGAYISLSTDCEYIECVGKNALGYSSSPGIGLSFGGGTRCHAKNCTAVDCGGTSGTNAADGFYVSGDNCTIANCTAESCTDTGMVIENGNNSGIIGGTAKNCNAAFAITNATNFTKRGNFIKGCTAIDWNSSVTGGVQIGCFGTGDLLDTSVDVTLVVVTGGKGTGPAVNVRKTSTGKVDGLTIDAIINGASTQGILVDGTNVRINGGTYIRGTTNACIQFQTGATGEVNGAKLFGGGFGVYAAGTASVRTCGNNIVGNSTQSYGLYPLSYSISGHACSSQASGASRVSAMRSSIDRIGQGRNEVAPSFRPDVSREHRMHRL